MPVVTISSEMGAGGRDVGRRVANRLHLEFVDHSVLVEAAQQLGVTVQTVAEHDERTDSLLERVGHFMQRALERSAAGGSVDPFMGAGALELMAAQGYQEIGEGGASVLIDDKLLVETMHQAIADLAARGDVVIIGRGGQMILREQRDAVHIQLVAERAVRVARVREWESLSAEEADHKVQTVDRGRGASTRSSGKWT